MQAAIDDDLLYKLRFVDEVATQLLPQHGEERRRHRAQGTPVLIHDSRNHTSGFEMATVRGCASRVLPVALQSVRAYIHVQDLGTTINLSCSYIPKHSEIGPPNIGGEARCLSG